MLVQDHLHQVDYTMNAITVQGQDTEVFLEVF